VKNELEGKKQQEYKRK